KDAGVTLAAGQAVVRVPAAGFALCFQRRYREFWIEADSRGSFSREMRPDIAVESLSGEEERLIVLDAKYRVGAGLNDALASAHMYRDALVAADPEGRVRRIVGAAYLLSPDAPAVTGDWSSAAMPGRLFHPAYRAAFRFGAVTLTPGMTPAKIGLALDAILRDAGGGAGEP
ncbi:MAG: nuclease domain-containing protein, partial [Phenylobacterium sp.]